MPWTIGLTGILLAGMVKGSDAALLYALPLPLALVAGAGIGFVNGLGIVLLGVSPIVMTLAVNSVLQGVALLYSNGTPDGFSSPLLRRFMTGDEWPVTPVVGFMALFVVLAVLLLGKTPFGRRIYASGGPFRRPGRRDADRRLYALRYLLGHRRRAADGLLWSGEPRHGR